MIKYQLVVLAWEIIAICFIGFGALAYIRNRLMRGW